MPAIGQSASVSRNACGWRGFWRVPSLASALALAACASYPANADSAPPAAIAAVDHACAVTMGLNPSEAEYSLCTRRLLETVAGLERPQRVARERAACLARGLQVGTPDFALCVVAQNQPNRY